MKKRLNFKKVKTLQDHITFWTLHRLLNVGSTQTFLKSIELIGYGTASFKVMRDHHLLNLIHRLQYAHHLDLVDLKNRINHLSRQSTDLKGQLDQLASILTAPSLDSKKKR